MTASLAALALKPDLGPESPRLASSFARAQISPAALMGVTFAHAGLLGLLLLAPATPKPITPPRPLMVSLIEPQIEAPQPEPKPRPQPPKPEAKPLPTPVLAAKPTPAPVPRPVTEAPEPTPAPEPVPEVLPPPAPVAEAPQPAPPPPPAPTPPRPADYLNNPKPPYPALSRRHLEEGVVWLRALINPDGSVAQLELHKSSGHKRLDDSAFDTVKNSWKFEPARQGGKPVAEWVKFPVDFTLTRS
jgi:protein TonB